MTTNSAWIRVDTEGPLCARRPEAEEKVKGAEGEVVLDFSSVLRIDSSVVRELEGLAGMADEKSVKIVLRAVNVDIYKVLKLLNLAQRFTFLT